MICLYCGAHNVEGVALCQECGITLKALREPLSLFGSSVIDAGLPEDRRREREEQYREYRSFHSDPYRK